MFRTLRTCCFCLAALSATDVRPQEILDGPPRAKERLGVRSCPDGMGVTGIHAVNNQLLCTPLPVEFSAPTLSTPPQSFPRSGAEGVQDRTIYAGPEMQWCGPDSILTGLSVTVNRFACSQSELNGILTPPRIPFIVADASPNLTVRGGMHACPVGSFVVGFHYADNVLLCGSEEEISPPPQDGGPRPNPGDLAFSEPGDILMYVSATRCDLPRLEIGSISVERGQRDATVPQGVRTNWTCQGQREESTGFAICPHTSKVLRVERPAEGDRVQFSCIFRQ